MTDSHITRMHDNIRAMHSFPKFCKPEWVDDTNEDRVCFDLYNHGIFVGEVYQVSRAEGIVYRWHCKTSDWRQIESTLEEAKQNLFMDYVKNWYAYRYGEIGAERIAGPSLDPRPKTAKSL
jgi:hypothetical protein